MRTQISFVGLTIALSFALISPASAVWVDNSSVPPRNNASAPIHVGEARQQKLGIFEVLGGFFTTGLRVTNNGNAIVDGKIGVGVLAPVQKLEVNGTTKTTQIQVTGGTPTPGKVLTASDAFGNATWQAVGAGGSSQWITNGSNIHYSAGKVGIGTSAPTQSLETTGNIRVNGGVLYMNTSGDHFGGGGGNAWVGVDGAFFVRNQADNALGTLKVGTICLGGYTGEACRTSWPSGSGGTGTVGPAGPAGPAGVSTTYTKQAAYSGGKGSVACNSGDIALGGGISQGDSDTSTGNWSVAQSRPNPVSGVATGWYCSGEAGNGRCFVICLDK